MNKQHTAIKLRGVLFEPDQIIGALKQHPQVSEANLGFTKDEKGRSLLIAYVVLRITGGVSISELRTFAKTKLFPQLVPDLFIILAEIPQADNNFSGHQAPLVIPFKTSLKEQGFREPRDATDILLIDIWSDLLGRLVGIDDDFFSEGGHSLLAVDLLSRIEKQTGQRLPMSTMLTKSTVRALADNLVHSVAPAVEGEIIELQKGRGGRPLFFLHGDYTGGGFFSRDVAHHADLDGPFLIVQPFGLSRTRDLELPDSIEAMAAAHLKEIRLKQSSGPYRLAGYCNGGMIAFEIAKQLLQAGEKVDFLGLIDPPAAHATPIRQFRPAPAGDDDFDQEAVGKPSVSLEEEYRRRLLNHYFRISAMYEAGIYREHLTVILVDQNKTGDPTSGWANVAKDNAVYRVDAKNPIHLVAIQKNAGAVGKILRSAIARLEEQSADSGRPQLEPAASTQRSLANLPYY